MEKYVVKIKGMMCEMCAKRVKDSLLKIEGVKNAKVSLKDEEAHIVSKKPLMEDEIKSAVEHVNYTYVGLEK